MTTSNQRLTFWCIQHREVCYATRAHPEVRCEQDDRVLSENFQRDKWHFCCGCQTFFARADNEAGNKSCPACGRLAHWRYLCQRCDVFSFEAESRLTQREFAFTPTGEPLRTCPGCLSAPPAQLFDHECAKLHASFKTARAQCPFCGDKLSAPLRTSYDFLPSFRKPLADYLQNMSMSPSAFRAEVAASDPYALAKVEHGRFWFTPFQGEGAFIVFPQQAQFSAAQDYQAWQNVFECEQPSAGEVWLVAPAVALFDSYAGEYRITQKGRLEVQARATVPLVEPSLPSASPPPVEPPRAPVIKPSTLSYSSAALTEPPTPLRRPPLPVLLGAGALVALLVGTMIYYAFNSAKRTIIAKAKQGQLVTPNGDSAYDVFMKGGLSESDLAALRNEVAPLLKTRGDEVVRQLVNDGYNPPANELDDATKLFGWLNQLVSDNVHKAREHYFQGRAAYERKDWSGAENDFRQAMRLAPAWALPVNTLARVYMRRKDFKTALTCYDEAIRIEPNWIFPRINKCVLANENLKNYVAGEQACRETLQLDANKASAYYYLGRALDGQGNKCGAYEQYRTAIEKAAGTTNPGFNVDKLNTAIGPLARQCGGA